MTVKSYHIDILSITKGVIVNPVNCVGVMGAGLALAFKNKYKKNYFLYKKYCDEHRLEVGNIFCTKENGVIIINAATKNHYSEKSSYEIINKLIINICKYVHEIKDPQDVYIPALGCGYGNLDWDLVKYTLFNNVFCWSLNNRHNYYIIPPIN